MIRFSNSPLRYSFPEPPVVAQSPFRTRIVALPKAEVNVQPGPDPGKAAQEPAVPGVAADQSGQTSGSAAKTFLMNLAQVARCFRRRRGVRQRAPTLAAKGAVEIRSGIPATSADSLQLLKHGVLVRLDHG